MRKKIYLMLTVTLASSMLLFGCGADEEKASSSEITEIATVESSASVEESKSESSEAESSETVSSEESAAESSESEEVIESTSEDERGYTTIEEYLAQPDIAAGYEAVIQAQVEGNNGLFTDITIEADGNNLVTTYYIADEYVEALRAGLEENGADSLADVCEQGKDAFFTECGIRPETMTYAYREENGELIVECTR